MAAHLHDSVLQTLAARTASRDDRPSRRRWPAARRARLRAWLPAQGEPGGTPRLAAAIDVAAAEVEDDHGVRSEVVASATRTRRARPRAGRRRERGDGQAAKFAGGAPRRRLRERGRHMQVYGATQARASTPPRLPADRRGCASPIVARMARHGGSARINAATGAGGR